MHSNLRIVYFLLQKLYNIYGLNFEDYAEEEGIIMLKIGAHSSDIRFYD